MQIFLYLFICIILPFIGKLEPAFVIKTTLNKTWKIARGISCALGPSDVAAVCL